MAVQSLIPESNLLYPLLFGKQRQGIKSNMALCDLICTYWKKQGNPATGTTMIDHLNDLIHNPEQFEWVVRAIVGNEVYEAVQNGEPLTISIDHDTGKAYYMVATKEHMKEIDEIPNAERHTVKEGRTIQELVDEYMYLATPSMRQGLDNDNEILLTVLGHCAEGGLL